jgi:methylenetetrahydrofolate reductase (NADPH)
MHGPFELVAQAARQPLPPAEPYHITADMTIADAYGEGRFGLSFELFPPKTAEGMASLRHHVDELVKFKPSYITCTFGAGGSTQDRTLEVIASVLESHRLPVATHLTCVGLTAPEIREYLARALSLGVENVVALRGDPPRGETEFKPVAGGFSYANELVEFIRSEFATMGIAVGGYPETHQEAPSPQADLKNLKRKVDAGADVVITQLFYDNADFFRFRDRCDELGIDVPIVPGLLPVTNGAQIQRIASLCGAKLPPPFLAALEKHADDPDGQFEAGVEFAIRQAAELLDGGAPGMHFYVLNKSEATRRVLNALPNLKRG